MLMRTSTLLSLPSSALQHTIGHVDCPACEADRLAMARTTDLKLLTFCDASQLCLLDELANASLEPRTHEDHRAFTRRLNRFFGQIALEKIHEGHILNYQKDRAKTAGGSLINHEVSFLGHVLDKAGLWKKMKPLVHNLVIPKSQRGRALSAEEEERLVLCAASNPRWKVAYLCSLLTVNTTAGAGEIRHIRVRYIDLRGKVLLIREGVKNEFRERNVPMTDTIQWICEQLLKRYYRLCHRYDIHPSEDHFVLPRLQNRKKYDSSLKPYDPTLPMLSWRAAWESLRDKAGLPKLRMYDLRHHIATKLMEDEQISDSTIEGLMGHGTAGMKKDYAHIRDKAKLLALQRHEVKPPPRMIEGPDGFVAIPMIPDKKPMARPPAFTLPGAGKVRQKL